MFSDFEDNQILSSLEYYELASPLFDTESLSLSLLPHTGLLCIPLDENSSLTNSCTHEYVQGSY